MKDSCLSPQLIYVALFLGACESGSSAIRTEDVNFDNGDVCLSGTLVLPEGTGPHPVIVFVHGSGPDTRSGYLTYGIVLAQRGIATLVYDKRGTGGSTGDWSRAGFDDLARDALAGLAMVRRRSDVASTFAGLVGVSQGGWIVPLAATLSKDVDFIVTISGSGVPPAEQVLFQWANRFRAHGATDAEVERGKDLIVRLWDYAIERKGWESLREALASARAEAWFREAANAGGLWRRLPRPEDVTWITPWLRDREFDPIPVWRQLSIPALVLLGARDESIPTAMSRDKIEQALREGGHRDHQIHVLPHAGHGMTPGHLKIIAEWIRKRAE